ncbi:TPA: replication initiation factor domain-containing protein [Streptococcus suis]
MLKYKVDWLAFSVSFDDEEQTLDPKILEVLGYDLTDFDEIPGRFFYNTGATYRNYVNVFWNDPDKQRHKNSSRTMTVVFTGQGSTELADKWDTDWLAIFRTLVDYGGVNFTRIDLALDDYDETVKFSDIEKKLNKGHYRSSRKSYNIVKTSDTLGRTLGETIYIGNARSQNGSRGNVYARFYDKKAQYESKNELFPSEVREHWAKTGKETWQRYEISFSKKYAWKIVEQFLAGDKVDKIFKTALRNLLEILTPRRGDTNKNRWYKTRWWEKFLAYDETMDFSLAERDVMLGDLLEWLRVAVLPSLSLLEEIGEDRGFDVYDLLRKAKKPAEFSKKQNRLYVNSQTLSDEVINRYLREFLGGGK